MTSILIAGSGQIGSAIGHLLSTQPGSGYQVVLVDAANQPNTLPLNTHLRYESLDVKNQALMTQLVHQYKIQAIISCLPYFLNPELAKLAKSLNLHYFDLTEDTAVTATIAQLATDAKTAFIPQCGLAPGFINIVANDLMKAFDRLDTVKLRCGALPAQASNALQYALTWSIDGLINEYGNPCHAIADGKEISAAPLTDLEEVIIDGVKYEAFNTSGGLGTLAQTYADKVNNLNYKTLRYPGHCDKMFFLMNDLKLNQDRENLKNILQKFLAYTRDDVVIVWISIQGNQQGRLMEHSYVAKFYPCWVDHQHFTAIQMATASSVCAVLDLVMNQPEKYRGFIHQDQFNLNEFLHNRFGEYFHETGPMECEHE